MNETPRYTMTNDDLFEPWYAPAGIHRGVIRVIGDSADDLRSDEDKWLDRIGIDCNE